MMRISQRIKERSEMDKLTNWVEQTVVPKVSRITSLRYFQALRNGFFAIMPLTITENGDH